MLGLFVEPTVFPLDPPQLPALIVGGRMVPSQQNTAGSHSQIGTPSGGPHLNSASPQTLEIFVPSIIPR